MSTSFSNYKSTTKPSILLVGPPGSGKTVLASMIGIPYIVEIDNNISGPFRFLELQKANCRAVFDVPHIEPDGTLVERKLRWTKMVEKIMAAVNDFESKIDTIVIDSLSGLTEYALDEVRRVQNRKFGNDKVADEQMQIQDWGVFGKLMREFFLRLRASGKTVIVIAHLINEKDELDGILKQFINVPGKFKDEIAGLFSECWALEIEQRRDSAGKTKTVHTIRTTPSSVRQAALGLKSGIQLGASMDIDFGKINQLLAA